MKLPNTKTSTFFCCQNEDDNALYCGGYGVQHDQNGGKCGICGDPWHQFPRLALICILKYYFWCQDTLTNYFR